jgi:hypothetical protein
MSFMLPKSSVSVLQSRRHILSLLPLPLFVACANGLGLKAKDAISKAAPFVRKESIWNASSYLEFLVALPPSGLLQLKKSLEILPLDATEASLKGTQVDVLEISTFLCQKASWFRICRNPADFDYHGLVIGIAEKVDVESVKLKWTSTFDVEHLVMRKIVSEVEADFVAKWRKMSVEDRKKVLKKVDPNGQLKDHAAIAAETGALAIRALIAVVGLYGFSAYVAATTALHAAASAVGATLPFVFYTSVTAAISVLTGPFGWLTVGVASIFGLAMAGRPEIKKMTSFVLTMHALKLDALRAIE